MNIDFYSTSFAIALGCLWHCFCVNTIPLPKYESFSFSFFCKNLTKGVKARLTESHGWGGWSWWVSPPLSCCHHHRTLRTGSPPPWIEVGLAEEDTVTLTTILLILTAETAENMVKGKGLSTLPWFLSRLKVRIWTGVRSWTGVGRTRRGRLL